MLDFTELLSNIQFFQLICSRTRVFVRITSLFDGYFVHPFIQGFISCLAKTMMANQMETLDSVSVPIVLLTF
jgi:hypothetical protein